MALGALALLPFVAQTSFVAFIIGLLVFMGLLVALFDYEAPNEKTEEKNRRLATQYKARIEQEKRDKVEKDTERFVLYFTIAMGIGFIILFPFID